MVDTGGTRGLDVSRSGDETGAGRQQTGKAGRQMHSPWSLFVLGMRLNKKVCRFNYRQEANADGSSKLSRY